MYVFKWVKTSYRVTANGNMWLHNMILFAGLSLWLATLILHSSNFTGKSKESEDWCAQSLNRKKTPQNYQNFGGNRKQWSHWQQPQLLTCLLTERVCVSACVDKGRSGKLCTAYHCADVSHSHVGLRFLQLWSVPRLGRSCDGSQQHHGSSYGLLPSQRHQPVDQRHHVLDHPPTRGHRNTML